MAEATSKEVISWTDKSVEERTPRKFRAKPPDVTVVVGGVQFFHYEIALSSNCEFFDNLLASQMRESKTATIEFPDREPSEWMELYKILDPMNYIGFGFGQSPASLITYLNVEMLLPWLDYLGMEQHLVECDRVLSLRITSNEGNPDFSFYGKWEQLKDFPFLPKTRQAIIAQVKRQAHQITKDVANRREGFEDLKRFLLDKECGDELWSYFVGSVVALPQGMIDDLDRHSIVSSVTFGYMVAGCCRPPKKTSFMDSSSDEESSSVVRRRAPVRAAPAPARVPAEVLVAGGGPPPHAVAPAPAPALRTRGFLDSDSDDDSDSS